MAGDTSATNRFWNKYEKISAIGTAAYPPRHWAPAVRDFLRGPGRTKTVFGTNFPTVGHRHALAQVAELDLSFETREALLGGTARRVFTRLL